MIILEGDGTTRDLDLDVEEIEIEVTEEGFILING